MSPADKHHACNPSAVTRFALLAFGIAAVASPLLAFWGREIGALRNWQYALAVLLLAAIVCTHHSGKPAPRVSAAIRYFLLGSLAWWMLVGEALDFAAMEVNGVDYSVFDWMLESSLRGRFMWSPIYGVNHFGVHQMWPLLALVPIHALLRFPFALCLVNVVLLTAGAMLLWQVARDFLDDDLTAALAVIAFVTNPWIGKVLSSGFRGESFFPIGIFLFVAAWLRGRPLAIGAAALILCLIKEDAPLYVLGFAAAAAFRPGRSRMGAVGLTLIASAVLALDLLIVRPEALKSSGTFQPAYVAFWSGYGTSLSAVALTIASSPWRVLKDVATSGWLRLLGPSLFLPLFSLETVGAMVPGFVMLGLAQYAPMRAFVGYHALPLVCAALCGILAVGAAHRSRPWVSTWVRLALLLFPLVGGSYFRTTWPTSEQREGLSQVRKALEDPSRPICAQTILFPQLGYPEDLRPLNADCQRLPGHLEVLNPRLDPWPDTRQALEIQLAAARLEGRSSEFTGGFAIIRAQR